MRRRSALVPLAALLFSVGCATARFVEVARVAVARGGCGGELSAEPLGGWGVRVSGCGETSYWRCHERRKSMGATQCCHRVASEDEARALVSFEGEDTCVTFSP